MAKGRAAEPPSNVINLMDALKRSISSEKEAGKETAKTQKTKAKKADDLRKQPQFKFPIEGGQTRQGKAKPEAKPAAKACGQARCRGKAEAQIGLRRLRPAMAAARCRARAAILVNAR